MAKAMAVGLSSIPETEIKGEPQANILFCRLSSALIQGLLAVRGSRVSCASSPHSLRPRVMWTTSW
jgi:threonine aldolase